MLTKVRTRTTNNQESNHVQLLLATTVSTKTHNCNSLSAWKTYIAINITSA